MTDLVVAEPQKALSFYELSSSSKVAFASGIAKELSKIIDQQKMYSVIGGKKFVTCEGWTTTLALIGVVPREKSIIRHEDGTYEAHVELVRFDNGQVVGGGSAICGMDEKTWAGRPEYARRSMACTRATGKAARLAYSWIVQLAGYNPTPAEEIPEEIPREEKRAEPVKGRPYSGDPDQAQTLSDALEARKISPQFHEEIAKRMMGKFSKDLPSIIKEVSAAQ